MSDEGLLRAGWRARPQICFACWVGDQDPDDYGLQAALLHMFASANFNYANVGSDIGGFRCGRGRGRVCLG